jgi:hypothetical protein
LVGFTSRSETARSMLSVRPTDPEIFARMFPKYAE